MLVLDWLDSRYHKSVLGLMVAWGSVWSQFMCAVLLVVAKKGYLERGRSRCWVLAVHACTLQLFLYLNRERVGVVYMCRYAFSISRSSGSDSVATMNHSFPFPPEEEKPEQRSPYQSPFTSCLQHQGVCSGAPPLSTFVSLLSSIVH